MSDRPLHVRVAEALGWTRTKDCALLENCYGAGEMDGEFVGCVRNYDTDWSATGPLIERHGISLDHDGFGMWRAYQRGDAKLSALGRAPLVAVCELLLVMAAAGKLAAS